MSRQAEVLLAAAEAQAAHGLRGPKPMDLQCSSCGQLFKFGSDLEPGTNVWTVAGARETQITQTCEACFDALFADMEEEDE